MKSILVTGGLGFIGSHFIQLLQEKHPNIEITNVDSKNNAVNRRTEQVLQNYRFIMADLTAEKDNDKIFDRSYDAIIQFVPPTSVHQKIYSVVPTVHSIVMATLRLLEAVRDGKAKRMIHVTSDDAQGELINERLPLQSKNPPQKNNPYTASNVSSNLLVRSFYQTYQVPVITTRSCNTFGENQLIDSFIPNTISLAKANKQIPIYGSGMQVREWIYVKDHCEALYQVLMRGRIGETYSISTNEEKRDIDVVRNILNRLDKPESTVKFIKGSSEIEQRYRLKSNKIQEELGWKPAYTFGSALDRTIRWYEKERIKPPMAKKTP